jgi:preprotein translocase subunit Sss1
MTGLFDQMLIKASSIILSWENIDTPCWIEFSFNNKIALKIGILFIWFVFFLISLSLILWGKPVIDQKF